MKVENYKRLRAQSRVQRIKGFYIHLFVFIIAMIVLLILGLYDFQICFICIDGANAVTNLLGYIPWAVGLSIHGLFALGKVPMFDRWEEKKIREYMEE